MIESFVKLNIGKTKKRRVLAALLFFCLSFLDEKTGYIFLMVSK